MKTEILSKDDQNKFSPYQVLTDLLEGNERFVADMKEVVNHLAQLEKSKEGQNPKAIILSCIDSRVPVEVIFDQSIGDIFVARVAGNFENVDILGSMEYACKVAGSKLVFVLGHESCGAIKAACDSVRMGNITKMLANIIPAVEIAKKTIDNDDFTSKNKKMVAETVATNVRLTINRIRRKSPILKKMEEDGEIMIVGGVYHFHNGDVEMIH